MADAHLPVIETVALPQAATMSVRLAAALGPGYDVLRLVGSGGFAEVYEVTDRALQRRLAVKVLRPDRAWGDGALARFRDEARAVAALDHPNILPIYFVGEAEGLAWYAMPFVEGESLSAVLAREGPMPAARAVPLIRGILAALQHAHEAGLVHRDIKPDNIMLEARTGRPLLVDFGIARKLDGGAGNTLAGFVVGTPAYMSPEQAMGVADIDGRADIYSLGALLFQVVTGTPPYQGDDSQEVVRQHLSAPVPTPESRRPDVPAWLSAIIVRALAKDRATRFQSAGEMSLALEQGGLAGAPAAPPASRLAIVVVAIALVMVLALGYFTDRPAGVLVVNRLTVPVGIVAGRVEQRLEPGDSVVLRLPRVADLALSWSAVSPRTGRGQVGGSDLQHTTHLDTRRRRQRLEVRADSGAQPVFLPYVSNATGQALTFKVNVGSAAEMGCRCSVPAGAVRVPLGFYPLYRNSSVRAILPDGRVATFEGLGLQVSEVTGAVRLRFEPRDFRDTMALQGRLR